MHRNKRLDNNKTVDNLNFIKIYFKVFIFKIITLKKILSYPEKRQKIINRG